jgi:hypothetical protein
MEQAVPTILAAAHAMARPSFRIFYRFNVRASKTASVSALMLLMCAPDETASCI